MVGDEMEMRQLQERKRGVKDQPTATRLRSGRFGYE
jgi:hypothetical protein